MKGGIVLFFLFSFPIIAQIEPGARQIALGNSSYAQADDVFSLFYNPAGLAQISWSEFAVYYSPAPFGLKELANGNFAFNYNFDFMSAALGGKIYGFELYRETTLYLGASKRFFSRLFAGGALLYKNVSIKNYGTTSVFVVNVGTLYYLTPSLRIGVVLNNPLHVSYKGTEGEIPAEFSLALSYSPFNETAVNVAVTREEGFPVSVKFGVEYGVFRYVDLRAGIETEPRLYSAGIGIKYGLVEIDYAALVHQTLAITHQIEIVIAFDTIENRREKIAKFLALK